MMPALAATRPDVVGISMAFPERAIESIRLARAVRRALPSALLVLGGAQISLFPRAYLSDDYRVDA